MNFPRFIPFVLVLASTGCIGIFSSSDVAPSGLSRYDDGLRRLLASGRYGSALARVAPGQSDAPGDELLRSLYEGLIAHYGAQFDASNVALQRASELAEERYTKSLSREALSLLSSDRILAYEPSRTERLFVHYYGALNYLERGDAEEAAVEARRLTYLLQLYDDREGTSAEMPVRAFLHYFAGLVYEAVGESNDAGVAYRRARQLAGPSAFPEPTVLPDTLGEVVVLLEQGFVAHRVEQAVEILLWPEEVEVLTDGEADVRLAAASCLTGRVVANAARDADLVYGRGLSPQPYFVGLPETDPPRSGPGGYLPYRCETVRKRGLSGIPYLLRIAWPVYKLGRPPIPAGAVVGSEGQRAPLCSPLGVSDAVIGEFAQERPLLLTRSILRAAAKFAVTKKVEKELKEKDEGLGEAVRVLMNAGGALLERADTRSWHLMPGGVGLARLRLPPGRHTPVLELGGDGGDAIRTVELGPVEVQPRRLSFLTLRTWR